MKNNLLLLLLTSCIFNAVYSQQSDSKNRFGVTIGFTQYQVKDYALNRIRHQGASVSGGFDFEKIKGISRQRINLFLIANSIKSRYDPANNSMAVNPNFTFEYLWDINDFKSPFNLSFGGITGFNHHFIFYENWDEGHAYWLSSYFLGIATNMEFANRNNSSFNLNFQMPLLALASRPPKRFSYSESNPEFSWIAKKIHENSTLSTIDRHVILNVDLGYNFILFKNINSRMFWRINYLKNNLAYSKEIKIINHSFGTTLFF